jgi:hypothetical protein
MDVLTARINQEYNVNKKQGKKKSPLKGWKKLTDRNLSR